MRAPPTASSAPDPWWTSAPTVLSQSNSGNGLGSRQVAELLQQYGPNRFVESLEPSAWRQYLGQFRNPLVLILLLASMVSALLGELTNCLIIATIVLASVTLDFFQEYRARNAAEQLRQSIALSCRVVRDGVEQVIAVSQIVPGDIVLLKAGDLVPADGWVIEVRDCFVNQSVLTGESYPVEKTTRIQTPAVDLQSATHVMFMGSSVVSGSARIQIVRTGSATEMGSMAGRIASPRVLTSFDIGTRRFNTLILRLTMLMVLFVLMVNLLSHKQWLESFLFALADRKSTRLNSSHVSESRMPSSA